ncbi:polyphosphate polymerase domain-containing protein [Solwaraspora sp. WMMD937]|uniref:polyphosphate polymerase domain-containing protein n=1 Tax=Solwaraspora sp. WMMD937 TaxID=3016090 RepID=UPI00249B2BAB|nr:polyphosphate polymerase domain-containing protein [Solwaraspora sp. WMMD937]WFE24174.1 polyphosphate polymerase domain-containing protein [Solwaraspora sp. WMMD937]
MTALAIAAALGEMAPIDLAELIERAALQTRVDRKYVVPLTALPSLLSQLPAGTRVLDIDADRSFRYESIYFDTPWLASYHCAAYRRRRRFKVRTRTYLDSGDCWLEVKINGARDSITKHRLRYLSQDRSTVGPGREFVDEVLSREAIPADGDFAPTLVTSYRRSTLLLPATTSQRFSRVTIDTELRWRCGSASLTLPQVAVVETKSSAAAAAADRLLWRGGIRPMRISKYATGLAALRPDLPDGPWRRTLRRHFCGIPAPSDRPSGPATHLTPTVVRHIEQEASCV